MATEEEVLEAYTRGYDDAAKHMTRYLLENSEKSRERLQEAVKETWEEGYQCGYAHGFIRIWNERAFDIYGNGQE